MERLERKTVNGKTYYYYSKWAWKDGKCRRVWQKYLGKLEDIAQAVGGSGPTPAFAEIFEWGLSSALWQESVRAEVGGICNRLCPKRHQGMTTGDYLAIAAINRASSPKSKRGMWEWFGQTVLLRQVPSASKCGLSSQRFWDHMDKIDAKIAPQIWERLIKGVITREEIDLSSISYDGTNFYTFIDTFNTRCSLANRGKNKQGRNNLRQVSYALFCTSDGNLPLYYDIYPGNRNDAKQFPLMLQRFHQFFQKLSGFEGGPPKTTIIFDKGNNSADNFALIDKLRLDYVGSVKLGEHKELAEVSNEDTRFIPQETPGLEGCKAFRVEKKAYGKERTLVVCYNQNLFNTQFLTLQAEIAKASTRLSVLQGRLQDRADGLISGGRSQTKASVLKQCKSILSRQYLRNLVAIAVKKTKGGIPRLSFHIDADALQKLSDTHLGKTILITSRKGWDERMIIKAYRSQYVIENVFKEMKHRNDGTWWPLHHWTNSKILVHGLYCTIAILLRSLILRRIALAGVKISLSRLLTELRSIREVINIYPRKPRQKQSRQQITLSKTSQLQEQLLSILQISREHALSTT
ncbi:MAG: IS1634 family transposase [Candidatus Margulisiibacteriota bacterium]